jgi:hypothetical protein
MFNQSKRYQHCIYPFKIGDIDATNADMNELGERPCIRRHGISQAGGNKSIL